MFGKQTGRPAKNGLYGSSCSGELPTSGKRGKGVLQGRNSPGDGGLRMHTLRVKDESEEH